MAIVEFGAGITALKGSIQGWTFQQNRAGHIVRSRPRPTKNPTADQTTEQSQFVSLIQDFQQLTPGQKLTWDAFSINNPKTNRFGEEKILTGQNWFTTINNARARLALGQLSVPPANLLPEAITSFNLVVDATKIEIDTITPNNPTDTGIFIFSSFPTTQTTKLNRTALRETKIISSGPFGTVNLTSDWETTHRLSWPPGGIANCINVAIQLVPVRVTTGITGPGLTVVGGLDFVGSGIDFMEIGSTFIVS